MKVRNIKFRRIVTPWIAYHHAGRRQAGHRTLVMGPRAYAPFRSVYVAA